MSHTLDLEKSSEDIKIDQEYAKILPDIDNLDYQSLKNSIRSDGQHVPIIVNQYHIILDGHHRYRICQELGILPKLITKHFEEPLEEKQFVIEVNLKRRHLNSFQIAELGYKLKPILAEIARKRQVDLAGTRKDEEVSEASTEESTLTLVPNEPKVTSDKEKTGRVKDIIADKIGLSPSTYFRAEQIIQKGPDDLKEKLRKGNITINKAHKQILNNEKKHKLINSEPIIPLPEGIKLYNEDFRSCSIQIPDNSIDLILTDPPYDKRSLSLYNDLALVAQRVLKPGGSLITYCGTYALEEILQYMKIAGLQYHWIFAIKLKGPFAKFWEANVTVKWKPMVWFVKGNKPNVVDFVGDLIESNTPQKVSHEWEQSMVEAEHIISRLTVKGQTVFDPMLGSGSFGEVALKIKRKFVGMEIDPETFEIANIRLGKVIDDTLKEGNSN